MTKTNLVVLYGYGGLSDVGRHAVLAGLERKDDIDHITVITKYPELLRSDSINKANDVVVAAGAGDNKPTLLLSSDWNCGCCDNRPHGAFTDDEMKRITIVKVEQSWNDTDLSPYLCPAAVPSSSSGGSDDKIDTETAATRTVVVSCVGNRQPFFGHWDSLDGNSALIRAIDKVRADQKQSSSFRVVVMTSVGIHEDSPALEFFTIGRIAMFLIYTVFAPTMYRDLRDMELLYTKPRSGGTPDDSNNNTTGTGTGTTRDYINYLLVRPVGLSEDVKPINQWMVQKEKYKHPLSIEVAKMDVARYMVEEAVHPTKNNTSVVIGSDPKIPIERTPPRK